MIAKAVDLNVVLKIIYFNFKRDNPSCTIMDIARRVGAGALKYAIDDGFSLNNNPELFIFLIAKREFQKLPFLIENGLNPFCDKHSLMLLMIENRDEFLSSLPLNIKEKLCIYESLNQTYNYLDILKIEFDEHFNAN